MQSPVDNPLSFTYEPIGTVFSPFTDVAGMPIQPTWVLDVRWTIVISSFTDDAGMPIQPTGALDVRGTIEIRPEFAAGLKDLEDFSRIILIYAFHRCHGYTLEVKPFLDPMPHGIFATRAPKRPNDRIGLWDDCPSYWYSGEHDRD